jgi:DNA-binding response OmpR family regulator
MQTEHQTVLVVDDDPAICAVVREVLEGAGHTVETVHDGPAALARIREGGLDLVLLDLMLPGMDGREVCRQVRAQARGLYLPIIMLTALERHDDQHAGFAAGTDDYIAKPFTLDDLRDRVQVWLRMRRRLAAAAAQRYTDTEAALQLARTPLQVLLNLVQVLETTAPGAEDVGGVRAQLAETAQALQAQQESLRQLLQDPP